MDKMINRPNIYKMNEFTMSHIHLTKDDLIGRHDWKGKLDLLNIVMIGLAKELPEHSEMYELHRLVGALLSNRLSLGEKLDIIGGEYAIPMEEDLRKDGQPVWQRAKPG